MFPRLKAFNKETGSLRKGITLITNSTAELEGATHLARIRVRDRFVIADRGSAGSRICHGAGHRAAALGKLLLNGARWRGHLAWAGVCS